MGCKQSRQVKVQPVGPSEISKSNKLKKCASENDPIEADIDDKNHRRRRKRRGKSSKGRNPQGSCDSLDDDRSLESDRGGSAGSKKSNDSGLGDLGEENHGFITEYSDPNKVKEVESGFREREDLDLAITGTTLPTRNSAKDKARLEEAMILQKLREEGLITKQANQSSGGVAFEIVENVPSQSKTLPSLPPLKLAKLEKRRKKKRALTEDEIREKLQRAEQRRKRKEQARLDRIKDIDRTDQTAALESFAEYQKQKEEQVTQKMSSVLENKERRMLEIKQKMQERERRREEVRKRKLLQAEMAGSHENVHNETPIPPDTPAIQEGTQE